MKFVAAADAHPGSVMAINAPKVPLSDNHYALLTNARTLESSTHE
jgi:hypothetical protein